MAKLFLSCLIMAGAVCYCAGAAASFHQPSTEDDTGIKEPSNSYSDHGPRPIVIQQSRPALRPQNSAEPNQWKMEESDTHTIGILYSDVPISNLVRSCFKSIPRSYREKCLELAYERFLGAVYPMKSRCCTKWSQIDCIEKYTYNAIYCNHHQQLAVSRYFDQIRSLKADGSPECSAYRPVKEEQALWSSALGRVAKCATPAKEPLIK